LPRPRVVSRRLVRARRSATRGQCGRAELALRLCCVRSRPGGAPARAKVLSWLRLVGLLFCRLVLTLNSELRYYLGLRLVSAAAARLLWSTSGPSGLRRRLRRRVPVNPGRRAGDAAREAAAGRAWRRATGDLPPRIPPEACWEPPQAPLRPRASPQAPPTPVHESPRPTEVPLTPKRCSSGQLYSEGARATPSGTRRARDKLISVFSCNKGAFPALFPSLAPPRNAKVGRAGRVMKAARLG